MKVNEIFAKRIREVRKESKLNQVEFAQRCDVKQSCVSKWERGATLPDAEMLATICRVLDVSADYLIGLKDY